MGLYSDFGDRFCTSQRPPEEFGSLPARSLDIPDAERRILRQLAAEKRALACEPEMEKRRARWRAANDLKPGRPPIIMDEICWNELDAEEELRLRCRHPLARDLEIGLRRELYRARHGLGDVVVEPFVECPLQVYDSGFGIDEDVDIAQTDPASEIVSRHFHVQIASMEDVQKIRMPRIEVDRQATQDLADAMREALGDAIEVRVTGARGQWFTPWDFLIRVMGVEETMYNLYDEPEMVEAAVERYVQCAMARMEAYEKLGIWASNNAPVRVGSGGYGLISCLPPADGSDVACKPAQMWGCSNAQIFSEISPDMHWQFSLQYDLAWLQRFGIVYYGCCEPLSGKMDLMDRIPNLRKVSMSPWNNFAAAAERCKGRYVMSCKPNPAVFAAEQFDEERAAADIRTILDQTRGCALELVMKDISTVRRQPERLSRWAQIAREMVEQFYA